MPSFVESYYSASSPSDAVDDGVRLKSKVPRILSSATRQRQSDVLTGKVIRTQACASDKFAPSLF